MNKHSTYNFDGKQVMGFPRAPYGDVSRDPASAVDIDRPGPRYGTWDAGVLEVCMFIKPFYDLGEWTSTPNSNAQ